MMETLKNFGWLNELEYGIPLNRFMRNRELTRTFVPVATLNEAPEKKSREEFVSIIEGQEFPFFGFAQSIHKT